MPVFSAEDVEVAPIQGEDRGDIFTVRQVNQAGVCEVDLLVAVFAEYLADSPDVARVQWQEDEDSAIDGLEELVACPGIPAEQIRGFRDNGPAGVGLPDREVRGLLLAGLVVRGPRLVEGDKSAGVDEDGLTEHRCQTLPCASGWCSGRRGPSVIEPMMPNSFSASKTDWVGTPPLLRASPSRKHFRKLAALRGG